MLRAISGHTPPQEIDATAVDLALAQNAVWLDMESPTEAERAEVERATGLRLPTQADVSEVEASSRLVQAGEVLTLSMPMVATGGADGLISAPLGFVLSTNRLITLRYAPSAVFTHFAQDWRRTDACGGLRPFLGLLEAMVDKMADRLEQEGGALEKMTTGVFGRDMARGNPRVRDRFLRATLTNVGRSGARISHVRDGLLGSLRIVRFVRKAAAAWTPAPEAGRLDTLEQDILSLNDYESQLINKVQFLLDATLGFINIEQNNSVKILTVVSLVGIPPTLIAGIYGMNFKVMPELNWTYGYPYGLAMIALGAVLPWLWFRWRGWV